MGSVPNGLPDGAQVRRQYTASGEVTAETDESGHTTRHLYDGAGRRVASTNAIGGVTQYRYNYKGFVTSSTDPLGRTAHSTYTWLNLTELIYPDGTRRANTFAGNLLTGETNQTGRVTRYEHDVLGRLIRVIDSLDQINSFDYDSVGNRIVQMDPQGRITHFDYDSSGRRIRTRLPDGTFTRVTYDAVGRRVSETDAIGKTTFFGYDLMDRLIAVTDALGKVTRYTYDNSGQLISQTDANGQITQFQYDLRGRRTFTIHPNNTTELNTYDPAGRRIAYTDPKGSTTLFGYDPLGRLTDVINALEQVTHYTYDPAGQLISRTDPNGQITGFEYDLLGRLTRTVYPDGTAVTASFDALGRRATATDPNGNTTLFGYDGLGRLTAKFDPLGQAIHYGYDELGRLTSVIDANNHTNRFEHDALGRLTRTVYPDGTSRSTGYDNAGRRISETDPANRTTQYTYDDVGRLTSVTDALGHVTAYTYDSLGRLVAQTDAKANTTTFEYDSRGRRTKRTLPGGQVETYGYDNAGNLARSTNFNGYVTAYSYDGLNRLIGKTPDSRLSQPPTTYAYNTLGLRTNMTDASGVSAYRYDNRNRLIEKTVAWTGTMLSSTLAYAYDAAGNVTNIHSSNPNGTDVSYEYDALQRLKVVNDAQLGRTAYAYDPAGNLEGYSYPNGVIKHYDYDALNRLTNATANQLLTPLAHYAYSVAATGHRLGATESLNINGQTNTLQRNYGYDPVYRLTNETITGSGGVPASLASASLIYAYDQIGNRVTQDSTLPQLPSMQQQYDANDRLLTDTYDANGNTIIAAGFNQTSPDRFDFEDRLIERQKTLNSQPSTLNFTYDGDGNRVSKTVTTATNNVTTFYLVDDRNPTGYPQVLEELTHNPDDPLFATPAVTRVYAYGHARLSQDQLLDNAWTPHFYGYDGAGSVRFLTDLSGNVTDSYDYDAFGNRINHTGNTPNNYLYRGEQFDPELGLYYLRARYLNPRTGRFWSQDSFEGFGFDPASLHKYAYGNNDPVNRIDPSGHFSLSEMSNVSTMGVGLGPILDGLWSGVLHYSQGLRGESNLFANSQAEARFIDGLSAGPGLMIGKENFWATRNGAPFLLRHNPNCQTDICTFAQFDLTISLEMPSSPNPIPRQRTVLELGQEMLGDLGGWAQSEHQQFSEAMGQTSGDGNHWALAGVLNTVSEFAAGALSLPHAITRLGEATGRTGYVGDEPLFQWISHLGEGTGRYWGNPSWANSDIAGAFQDVSTIAGLLTPFARCTITKAPKGVPVMANYAQTYFRKAFSARGSQVLSEIVGRPIKTIDDLVAAILSGKVDPSQIPVNYITRGKNTLILDTRTSQALERAGIPRADWNGIDRSSQSLFEQNLSGQLKRNQLSPVGTPLTFPE